MVITQFESEECSSGNPLPEYVTSLEEFNNQIVEWKELQFEQGYLISSIDTFWVKQDSLFVSGFCGPQYEIHDVRFSGDTLEYYDSNRSRENKNRRDVIKVGELQQLQNDLITYYENHGYPFVTTKIFPTQNDLRQVLLKVDAGTRFTLDSIIIHSNSKLSQNLIERIINYQAGDVYREDRIRNIEKRLSSTGYLRQKSNPQVSFVADRAKLHVFVQQEKSSRFDVLLGLTRNEQDDKPTITGKGEIDLLSAFGKGERLFLLYENLINNYKQLEATIAFPFVLQMPFGVLGEMNIDIRDTILRNTKLKYGISYQLRGNQSFSAYFEDQKIRNLNVDTNRILQGNLPSNIDANRLLFGGAFSFRNTNSLVNPTKGWRLWVDGSLGSRRIVENSKIVTLVEDNELVNPYDSLTREQNIFRVHSRIQKYSKLQSRFVLFNRLEAGWLQFSQENGLGLNGDEAFRKGGIQNIRGFDEESILTDKFAFLSNEIRWLWDQQSNVYLFQDVMFTNDIVSISEAYYKFRYGFGAGVTLRTSSGVFSISYALGGVIGRTNEETVGPKIRNAKVHFGYNIFF